MAVAAEVARAVSLKVGSVALVCEEMGEDRLTYFHYDFTRGVQDEDHRSGTHLLRFVKRQPKGDEPTELTFLHATVFVTEDKEGKNHYTELNLRVETVGHPPMKVDITHREEDPTVRAFFTIEGPLPRNHRFDWDGETVTVDQGTVNEAT